MQLLHAASGTLRGVAKTLFYAFLTENFMTAKNFLNQQKIQFQDQVFI